MLKTMTNKQNHAIIAFIVNILQNPGFKSQILNETFPLQKFKSNYQKH